ncbi:MAG: hypothetical protein FJ026_05235 [Chloroflexi bacterium]|nr:hypothetical protein [Chloroflexota bacterium]
MVLQFADGRAFATGACPYRDQPTFDRTRTPRITIAVWIGGFQTQAVVDTGGVYLVCDPEIRDLLNLNPSASLGIATLVIRGYEYRGDLHRVGMTLLAKQGESLELEVTAFIPRLDPGQEWRFPSLLGLQGCLEFLRFAVDPGTNVFYFGPL